MPRIATIVALVGLWFALSPAVARAQFMPAIMQPGSPYSLLPYQYQFNLGTTVPTTFGRTFVGVTFPFTAAPQFFSPLPQYTPTWYGGFYSGPSQAARMSSSGYLSGGNYGTTGRYGYDTQAAQRDFVAAQRDATRRESQTVAKDLISSQWAYERLGITGQSALTSAKSQAEELEKALAVRDQAVVASGTALNRILVAIIVAESRGGKGVAAFLPPALLDEVRYTGGPAADLLNLVRQSGKIPFPASFDDPTLKELRDGLQEDFSAAVASLRAGKPVEPAKVAKLEATLKKVELAAPSVIRETSFEDAIATRKFLNQCAGALRALKGPGLSGLVNPKWATEGTNVADLVKHLTKYKVTFGPAPAGSEANYLALHRALATYLFLLNQPKK